MTPVLFCFRRQGLRHALETQVTPTLLQGGQELVVCNKALATRPQPVAAQPAKALLATIWYLHS